MYVDISDDLSLSKVEVTVPTTSTFLLYSFFVTVHLEFELLFFFKGKISYNLNNSIGIKIVIISNNRAVF